MPASATRPDSSTKPRCASASACSVFCSTRSTCHEPPADGDHLLLAAGERPRELPPPLRQLGEDREHVLEAPRPLRASGGRIPSDQKVVEHGHLGEELPALRHVHDAKLDDPGGRETVEPMIVQQDAPGPRVEEPRDGLERRRLSGPVRADHGDDLAVGDLEADSPERLELAVGDFETLDAQHARPPASRDRRRSRPGPGPRGRAARRRSSRRGG